jgi:hypothetical protein
VVSITEPELVVVGDVDHAVGVVVQVPQVAGVPLYGCRPRWYEWERDLADLLELLGEEEDPTVKPVEISLSSAS